MQCTILTSLDGIKWDLRASAAGCPTLDPNLCPDQTLNASPPDLDGVTWSTLLTQFVAVGTEGTILTSHDGVTWGCQDFHVSETLAGIIRSRTQYVVVGYAGTIVTSPDGVNWTSVPITNTEYHLESVAWSSSQGYGLLVQAAGF